MNLCFRRESHLPTQKKLINKLILIAIARTTRTLQMITTIITL